MLGIDERHVREVPRSDAHRLAAQGVTTATFRHVGEEPDVRVDHVEVVDAGEWCVLRHQGILPGVTVVDPAALSPLARDLLSEGEWEVDYDGDPPSWLPTADPGR